MISKSVQRRLKAQGVDIDAVHKVRRNQPEAELQKRVVAWADHFDLPCAIERAPERLGDYLFHVPRGNLSKAQAGVFKAMGARAGILDLFLLLPVVIADPPGGFFHCPGAVLELKDKGKRPNTDQREMLTRFSRVGYQCAWADEYEPAIGFLRCYVERRIRSNWLTRDPMEKWTATYPGTGGIVK